MNIKHTILFTLWLAFGWTASVFAYSTGPDPGVNGAFGTSTNCAVCHGSFLVNTGNGGVSLTGQPAAWMPGQTYPLTITVQPSTGSRRYGFQLSAIVDSTNQQAGILAKINNTVQTVCSPGSGPVGYPGINCSAPGAIQFAEHTNANSTTTFTVNWTAPSSAGVGTVRFNLAGNSANGDGADLGDRIYTKVYTVDPAVAPDLSTKAFMIVDRGGLSAITDGSGSTALGYARIQPDLGSTTPAGVAIFSYRPSGVLVSETGVPASLLVTSARIYADVNGPVRTGIAIANPNNQTANITFHFTDSAGVSTPSNVTAIAANNQIAKFIDEVPFSVGTSFQGTFSLSSDVPVSLIALRLFTSERNNGDSLLTTLPVIDLSVPTTSGTVYLPHFADGTDGFKTQVILVNPSDSAITGTIRFFNPGSAAATASPITIAANGEASATFTYTIPGQSSYKLLTDGMSPGTVTGSVRITPATGVAPTALAVFSFKPGEVTLAEAGVQGVVGSAFRIYAEENTPTAGVGAIQTGFAAANLSAAPSTVNLELFNLDGTSTGFADSVTIPGNGQIAGFLHDVFPTLMFPFQGILCIGGGESVGLSVVSLRLRYNERGELLITTTPPSNEGDNPPTTEVLFPDLVNGGGFTTQFILFSGSAGQVSTGTVSFLQPDGTAFSLNVN
jgi:hypothetical protein